VRTIAFQIGSFRLDLSERMLSRDGVPLPLGPRAVAVLAVLVERAHRAVAREAIMEAAWPGLVVEAGNVHVQVATIRKALAHEPGGERWIRTLPRRGYSYVGPIAAIQHSGPGRMVMSDIPFGTTDWAGVESTRHPGRKGFAEWRTRHFGPIRVRMVEYSPGYVADHWCTKGHILLCMSGELHTLLHDGRRYVLKPGMSYQVADGAEAHRSSTQTGARLFIVD